MAKFCFGDIVVVDGDKIGVVVKSWGKSLLGKPNQYEVYIRSYNGIADRTEDQMERYMVRHKYLDDQELQWQRNAVEG